MRHTAIHEAQHGVGGSPLNEGQGVLQSPVAEGRTISPHDFLSEVFDKGRLSAEAVRVLALPLIDIGTFAAPVALVHIYADAPSITLLPLVPLAVRRFCFCARYGRFEQLVVACPSCRTASTLCVFLQEFFDSLGNPLREATW